MIEHMTDQEIRLACLQVLAKIDVQPEELLELAEEMYRYVRHGDIPAGGRD